LVPETGCRLPIQKSSKPHPETSRMLDTGYGSAQFVRACDVASACRGIQGHGPRATWDRMQAGSLFLRRYQRSLPMVAISLTWAPPGRMIGQHFAIREGRRWRYRDAQGVLDIPEDFAQYLRGRHRQAIRTNVGHARKAGLTVMSCAIDNWAPGSEDSRVAHITPGPVERWMVLDADREIVADSILSVDEKVALLHGLVSWADYARWLLHASIVERLCGHCTVLLTNSDDAYLMGAGNLHFQRLLGYRISRLHAARPSRARVVTELSPEPAGLAWPPEPLSWRLPEP
jgi:hypothetical protein